MWSNVFSGRSCNDTQHGDLWLVSHSSVYRLNTAAQTIARVTGTSPPSALLGADGTARSYESLMTVDPDAGTQPAASPIPGKGLVVSWGGDGLFTQTGTIISVSARPAWGRSYWVSEPLDLKGAPAIVWAAGLPALACRTLDVVVAGAPTG